MACSPAIQPFPEDSRKGLPPTESQLRALGTKAWAEEERRERRREERREKRRQYLNTLQRSPKCKESRQKWLKTDTGKAYLERRKAEKRRARAEASAAKRAAAEGGGQ